MRLLLIRHAEAERGEASSATGAPLDLGLTRRGRSQAAALASHLRATRELEDCRALLYSPSPRARQTAEILADALSSPAITEEVDLSEIGDLPASASTTPPGGESLSDFFSRARSTLQRLADRHSGETIVAVTHAGFIMASIRVLFDIPTPGTRARLDPDYASLTEWRLGDGVWRLARYNVSLA